MSASDAPINSATTPVPVLSLVEALRLGAQSVSKIHAFSTLLEPGQRARCAQVVRARAALMNSLCDTLPANDPQANELRATVAGLGGTSSLAINMNDRMGPNDRVIEEIRAADREFTSVLAQVAAHCQTPDQAALLSAWQKTRSILLLP